MSKEQLLRRKQLPGVIRFAPKAWAKLLWFRDRGSTEIAGFGVSSLRDPLYVEEFHTIEQEATVASFEFGDDAANDYLTRMVKAGRHPAECFRIWLHTHPIGASPSGHDEDRFVACFGKCDWSVMFIMGKNGDTYARLRLIAAKGALQTETQLKVVVDCSGAFSGVTEQDAEAWEAEYQKNIKQYKSIGYGQNAQALQRSWWRDDYDRDFVDQGVRHEPKPDFQEIELTPEQYVWCVESTDWNRRVLTDHFWFDYDTGVFVTAEEGSLVGCLSDIAEEAPYEWGELEWDDDQHTCYTRTGIWDGGKFEALGAGEQCKCEVLASSDVVDTAELLGAVLEEGSD